MTGRPHDVATWRAGRVSLVLCVCLLVVLLLDASGLHSWASGLPLGPNRDGVVGVTSRLESITSTLQLHRPREFFRHQFQALADRRWRRSTLPPLPVVSVPDSLLHRSATSEVDSRDEPPPFYFSDEKPLQVLLLGDSLMGYGFGTSFERVLQENSGVAVRRQCIVSSGLSRPDFFSWPDSASHFLRRQPCDLAFVILGTNDPQRMSLFSNYIHFGTAAWLDEYRYRTDCLIDSLGSQLQHVYWIGLPPMREDEFDRQVQVLNKIYEQSCLERPFATYIDIAPVMGDSLGRYANYLEIAGRIRNVRHTDGVHITTTGGRYLAGEILHDVWPHWEPHRLVGPDEFTEGNF
ncbi:MAG: DUF459 domain-containing protein [bacterium]